MPRFVILVEFKLKPGAGPRFNELVLANAAASARDEPGCRRFDVMSMHEGDHPETVWLYEIYDSPAAFAAHLETPHYAAFKTGTDSLVERATVHKLDVIEHAKP